ncbi:MAG: ATP12 family chaperone protein [Alphaproteobacteria bacterium]|jgi:chaperone required for assembly of F1-ATPase
MKRFYKTCASAIGEGGFVVTLDDRPVRTPARAVLTVPTAGLADAIAREWDGQGEEVKPLTMPLMRLATTAIDRVATQRGAILDDLAAYGGSDLLCYRAEQPRELVERQSAQWQPLIDWAASEHDAILAVTGSLVAVQQPEPALRALRQPLEALDSFSLVSSHTVTSSTGSLVVALALLAGRIDGKTAFELGALDDLYALEVWGEDKEARERLNGVQGTILAAEHLLALVRNPG